MSKMTDFETINKHETEFGNHSFIEISRMLAKGTEEKGTEFIAIRRSYMDGSGRRRIKNHVTIPNDPEVIGFVVESLRKV